MHRHLLSFNTRKSLCNHLGEDAGQEVAELIAKLTARIEWLENHKVDVTPIAPGSNFAAAHPQSPSQ